MLLALLPADSRARSGPMTAAPITALYAAVLTLLFLLLSLRVIRLRGRSGVTIGTADNVALQRAARAHANFAEYVPLALLLMLLVEVSGGRTWELHAMGVLLVAGRAIHAWGVSQVAENLRFRVTGMALTFVVLTAAALSLLAISVPRIA